MLSFLSFATMAWALAALVAVALITGLTLVVVAFARELISNRRLVREMQRQGKVEQPLLLCISGPN